MVQLNFINIIFDAAKNEAKVKLYTDGSKIFGVSNPKYFYPRTSLRITLPDLKTYLTQFILHYRDSPAFKTDQTL